MEIKIAIHRFTEMEFIDSVRFDSIGFDWVRLQNNAMHQKRYKKE